MVKLYVYWLDEIADLIKNYLAILLDKLFIIKSVWQKTLIERSKGLGTILSTRRSCVRIPLRSRLVGSQCHIPPQEGTGSGKMDDTSLPTVRPALIRTGG